MQFSTLAIFSPCHLISAFYLAQLFPTSLSFDFLPSEDNKFLTLCLNPKMDLHFQLFGLVFWVSTLLGAMVLWIAANPQQILPKQSPMLEGSYKLNFDANAEHNPEQSRIGGVIHDSKAIVVRCFSRPAGIHNNHDAELTAMVIGMHEAIHLQMCLLSVECDSFVTISQDLGKCDAP